jgi:predicted ATPase
MIREIQIKNFKSLDDVTLELGRVNVLIGANGCGKTNILEAICLGGAAVAGKLDNEFLKPRGIRYAPPREMRSGFNRENLDMPVLLHFFDTNGHDILINLDDQKGDFPEWTVTFPKTFSGEELKSEEIENFVKMILDPSNINKILKSGFQNKQLSINDIKSIIFHMRSTESLSQFSELSQFLIYAPNSESVRILEEEGRTLPLGISGSGLFRLLQGLSKDEIERIKLHLRTIDWFDDFEIPETLIPGERKLRIKDQYMEDGLRFFEHRVANEGFLFLLFYLCLFISKHTPKFFAIDNLDNGFNPKLCAYTAKTLCELAKTHDKQAIITTHNPSVLDGLDLKDDENRLFVVYRNIEGRTRIRRILPKDQPPDEPPVRLSEAFLRGYIGGLPDNF